MSLRLGPLTGCSDVSPGVWLIESLLPWGSNIPAQVGSLVPPGFEAYGRLFHPAYRRLGDEVETPVRWDAVAAANGRHAHPAMEWVAIGGSWDYHHRQSPTAAQRAARSAEPLRSGQGGTRSRR
jgi:hypothetical protein